mgnify:CR=1 FL=1
MMAHPIPHRQRPCQRQPVPRRGSTTGAPGLTGRAPLRSRGSRRRTRLQRLRRKRTGSKKSRFCSRIMSGRGPVVRLLRCHCYERAGAGCHPPALFHSIPEIPSSGGDVNSPHAPSRTRPVNSHGCENLLRRRSIIQQAGLDEPPPPPPPPVD